MAEPELALPYAIVDTGQVRCYDNRTEIAIPQPGQPFFGQDAAVPRPSPSYRDNGDGTVSDLVTGLMWQKDPGAKKTFAEAIAGAADVPARRIRRLAAAHDQGAVLADRLQRPRPRPARAAIRRASGRSSTRDYFVFHYGDAQRRRADHRLAVRHLARGTSARTMQDDADDVRRQLRRRPHQGLPVGAPSPRPGERRSTSSTSAATPTTARTTSTTTATAPSPTGPPA